MSFTLGIEFTVVALLVFGMHSGFVSSCRSNDAGEKGGTWREWVEQNPQGDEHRRARAVILPLDHCGMISLLDPSGGYRSEFGTAELHVWMCWLHCTCMICMHVVEILY